MVTQEKIKNILIVGRTGSGKSTLANVLSGTSEFKENSYSVRGTKNSWRKFFEHGETKYCVIDTPGIANININEPKDKITEAILSTMLPEEISQVLFLIDERFTVEEMQVFELFKKEIFNSDIAKFTTIVRTKFPNFKNEDECNKDKDYLCTENELITEVVESCNGIVYVDNPPTNINPSDDDDEKRIEINRKRREKSRIIILNHLEKVF